MNYRLIATGLLATALCLGLPACKKKDSNDNSTTAQALAETGNGAKWDKSQVNGLLKYIPSDAPLVVASTREIGLDAPFFKESMKLSGKFYKTLTDGLKTLTADPELSFLSDLLSKFESLTVDYAKNAPEFGLHPWAPDSVAFMHDSSFVFKLSIADRAKFKEKLSSVLSMPIDRLTDDVKLVKEDSEYRTTLTFKDNDDIPTTELKLIIDYGVDAVTVIVPIDPNAKVDVDRLLAPAANPVTKDKLGKIDSTVQSLGYVDNVVVLKKMLEAPVARAVLKDILETDITPECGNELSTIVADYPRLNFVNRIVSDKKSKTDLTLVFADKQELKNIQALHAKHLNVGDEKSIMNGNLSVNVDSAFKLLTASVTDASKKVYKCESIQTMVSYLGNLLTSIPPEAALIMDNVRKFRSLSFALNALDVSNPNAPKIETAVSFGAESMADVLTLLKLALLDSFPQIASLKPNADAPVNVDLGEYKINAYMTDNDLVVATPSYDVKALSKRAPQNDTTFLSIEYNLELLAPIIKSSYEQTDDPEDKKVLDATAKLYAETGGIITTTVGTNDEGLVISAISTLK